MAVTVYAPTDALPSAFVQKPYYSLPLPYPSDIQWFFQVGFW